MGTLLQDLRYGIRMMLKNPGFTTVAMIALALGIGANTAMFSVVEAVLLRPLPYKEPNRLVRLFERGRQLGLHMAVSLPNFFDWRDQNRVFEQICAYRPDNFNLTGIEPPVRILGAMVSANLFSTLGASPALGRAFLPEDDKPGANPVILLSHGAWQGRFGGDPNFIGKHLTLNGRSFTVVGIMPADFDFPERVELWVPISLYYDENPNWMRRMNHPGISAVARLKPGVTIQQARTEMDTIARRLEQQYPESNDGQGVFLVPLYEDLVGNIRPALLILLGAVAFVLLIACANVANLLLARAVTRQKEIAIRTALGASRLRVVRQLLTESVLLSLLGGGLGVLLALWGVDPLVALIQENIPRVQNIAIKTSVLGFTLLVSLLTGVIAGLAPGLYASKTDLNQSLKEGGRSATGGRERHSNRNLLAVSEIALAFVLLIGAGLMVQSFIRLRQVNLGFQPQNVLTMQVSLSKSKYPKDAQRALFYQQVLERISTLPGVQSAGAITPLPMTADGWQNIFVVEGQPRRGFADVPFAHEATVTPDYFRAMGIPLLKGRYFTERDGEPGHEVAIIDETMAERYWPNENPIGKRLKFSTDPASKDPWVSIVGVVGHVKNYSPDVVSAGNPEIQVYVPYRQETWPYMNLVVRTASDPAAMAGAVQAEVRMVGRDMPVSNIKTMEQVLYASVSQRRFSMLLISMFAALGLVLATVGIYGVVAYSVSERTHEIGIRMALGAQPSDVLKLVIGHALMLAVIGVTIGLAAAFALTRALASLLYGVSATDPITFAGISLLLAGVVLLASYIPARRATKVDPMVALRHE